MDDLDKSWETRKYKEQELAKKKRRRMTEVETEQKPKRMRRLEYALLDEHWGEDDGQEGAEDEGGDCSRGQEDQSLLVGGGEKERDLHHPLSPLLLLQTSLPK